MNVNHEGCFCEYASKESGGASVVCQYCYDEKVRELAAANKRINDLTTQRDRAMADYETEGMKAGRMADRIAELEADLVARDKRASDLNIGRTAQAELALQEFEKMRARIVELEADVARLGTTAATDPWLHHRDEPRGSGDVRVQGAESGCQGGGHEQDRDTEQDVHHD